MRKFRPAVDVQRLESRHLAPPDNTDLVDHCRRGDGRDAGAAVGLRKQLLRKLIFEPVGGFVVLDPGEPELGSVQGGHHSRAQQLQERLTGDRGCSSAGAIADRCAVGEHVSAAGN